MSWEYSENILVQGAAGDLLEQELGIVIFDRDPKGMTLTDAGKEFLEGASLLDQSFGQLEVRYGLCACRT